MCVNLAATGDLDFEFLPEIVGKARPVAGIQTSPPEDGYQKTTRTLLTTFKICLQGVSEDNNCHTQLRDSQHSVKQCNTSLYC